MRLSVCMCCMCVCVCERQGCSDYDPHSSNTQTIQIIPHALLNLVSISCVLDMKRGILKTSFTVCGCCLCSSLKSEQTHRGAEGSIWINSITSSRDMELWLLWLRRNHNNDLEIVEPYQWYFYKVIRKCFSP